MNEFTVETNNIRLAKERKSNYTHLIHEVIDKY